MRSARRSQSLCWGSCCWTAVGSGGTGKTERRGSVQCGEPGKLWRCGEECAGRLKRRYQKCRVQTFAPGTLRECVSCTCLSLNKEGAAAEARQEIAPDAEAGESLGPARGMTHREWTRSPPSRSGQRRRARARCGKPEGQQTTGVSAVNHLWENPTRERSRRQAHLPPAGGFLGPVVPADADLLASGRRCVYCFDPVRGRTGERGVVENKGPDDEIWSLARSDGCISGRAHLPMNGGASFLGGWRHTVSPTVGMGNTIEGFRARFLQKAAKPILGETRVTHCCR